MLYPKSKHKPQARSRSRNIDSRTSKDNKPKYVEAQIPMRISEIKTLHTDPEYITEEIKSRLLEWVWPIGKQRDTTVLTANRLFGRNDKGFLLIEKAKEITYSYSLDLPNLIEEITVFVTTLQKVYLDKIEVIYNDPVEEEWSKITASEALGVINILNQIDRYKVFNIQRLKELKDRIWKVLIDKTLMDQDTEDTSSDIDPNEILYEINTITTI
nr:MAG TPA: hypothetical protein [Caudoviricetes sp.]